MDYIDKYDQLVKLLTEEFEIDGKKEGEYKLYYVTGQLMKKSIFMNDQLHGEYKKYFQKNKNEFTAF